MKLFVGKKKNALGAIEEEIAALEKRRETLQAKLDAASNALELSRIDRRNHLINAVEDDTAGTEKIAASILAGERDVTGLRDALDEIDSRIVEARSRLEIERAGDERERRAASLERAADDLAAKARSLESAVDALAIAAADFIQAIPDDTGIIIDRNGFAQNDAATPAELAAAVISQGLCMTAPTLFEQRNPNSRVLRGAGVERALSVRCLDGNGRISSFLPGRVGEKAEILPTSIAAEQIVVEPLRAQAAALRASDDMKAAAE